MRAWGLGLFGRKTPMPIPPRVASMIRSDTRDLIRIANEMDRARAPAPNSSAGSARFPAGFSEDLWRSLTVAESQLTNTIAASISRDFSVRFIEQEVIRPILGSAVVVSALAHEVVERAIRSAAGDRRQ